jgi:membrane protein DedA with SNARE-associated domain
VARVRPRLERWDAPVLLGVRFVPGLSIVGLLAAGLYGVPVARFMALNAVAALGWAAAYGTLGYLLGHAVERVLGGIGRYERPVALVLLALALLWIAVTWLRRWRRTATDGHG